MISIITINYNQPEATRTFLESCSHLRGPEYEIIVVDNASENPPDQVFQQSFPEVRFILSRENLGFAGGNNLGIQAARGEYLFFLNNDVVVTPDLLEKLLHTLESHPSAAGVSPVIHYVTPPGVIQYAGYTAINPWTGRNHAIGKGQHDTGQFVNTCTTAYLHGAAMLVRRTAIEATGLMPEEFFLYYEELDWCEQMRRKGFQLLVDPKAIVYHHASLSVGGESTLWTYYYNRNRIRFMQRNTRWYQYVFFLFYFYTVVVPRTASRYLFTGKFAHVQALFRAVMMIAPKAVSVRT
ncbi:MAG: glycosyltransferase family 2 protein [Bacteroidia bacterium]